MDFLNQSFAQVKELFLSMSPGARITSALLLAVVVISLGYLFTHEIAGPNVYLLGGEMFSASDINSMATAFSQEGLDSYEIEGNRIRVPRNQRGQYMAALGKYNALPEDFSDIFTKALEAGGRYISPSDRQAYIKGATEKRLSRMLSDWPNIEKAYVVYGTKRKSGWTRETMATASVQIKPRNNEPLDPAVISSIRKLVVGAIPALEAEHCAVTDMSTMRTTVGGSEGYGSPLDDLYIAKKQHYEKEYKDKILEGLGWIAGVTVTPYVELDTEMNHREEQVKYDPKGAVTVSQSESSVERSVDSTTPAGRPGYVAQGNAARSLATNTAKGSSETETQTDSTQQSLPSTTRTTSETAGLTPKRVSVAVTVPTSYYEKVWLAGNPPKEDEEAKTPEASDLQPLRTQTTEQIKNLVATIIPQPADGTDPKDLVTVAEFLEIAPPEIPEPSLAANAFAWLGEYWSTVGLIGLVFFSLLMLRSMTRAAPAPSTAEAPGRAPATGPRIAPDEEETGAEESAERQLQRFAGSGASLRDELSELVNEDPDIAANILRNWIGTAT